MKYNEKKNYFYEEYNFDDYKLIEGLNGSKLYVNVDFENYYNKVDYGGKTVKRTIECFDVIRTLILNILNLFQKYYSYSMNKLIELQIPISLDILYQVGILEIMNNHCKLLPNSAIEKIRLFLEIMKKLRTVNSTKGIYNWLKENFEDAKSIYDEFTQSKTDILDRDKFNEVLKHLKESI